MDEQILTLVLAVVAVILSVVELIRTRFTALLAWAVGVASLALAFLVGLNELVGK